MAKRSLGWTDVCLAIGLALVIGGLALSIKQSGFGKTDGLSAGRQVEWIRNKSIGETQVSNKVVIDISGAVMSPGVYEMGNGGRIIDVLKLCGGLSVEADRDWVDVNINKARLVRDGEKIYILSKSDAKNGTVGGVVKKAPVADVRSDQNGLINLNTATTEELDRLPGIGPALAGRIIDYRQENNGFVSVDEIKLVSGIGDKVFEKFKDLIMIN